jgi:uncharacterized membrane protein YeiB
MMRHGITVADPVPRPARVAGVDVARGAALLGMMAMHTLEAFDDEGAPTMANVVAAGRSTAMFVLLAGVSMAFMSGGRRVVQGRDRLAVSGGLVVRALLIGVIGLALGMLAQESGVEGILPFYAVLFLLAIPLLGLPPLALAGVVAAVVVVGPVLCVAAAQANLPYSAYAGSNVEPSFATLAHDPLGQLVQLFVTGEYPVVVYLAYICAGLAIGRLDLTSHRMAWWLFGGGIALAVGAQLTSALLLYPLGGLGVLVAQSDSGGTAAAAELLWEQSSPTSWWFLALPTPHSHTPVDLVHTLGSAIGVLGAALLLTRLPTLARMLSPLAAAGTMALTLYSAQLVLLATGVLHDEPDVLYLVMVLGAIAFALLWRRWLGQGPLERVVAIAAGATRRRLADRLARRPASARSDRLGGATRHRTAARAAMLLVPVACVGTVVLAVAGTRFDPGQEHSLASAEDADPATAPAAGPAPTGPPGPAAAAGGAPDLGRFCQLYEQVGDLEDQYSDDHEAVVGAAGPLLDDLPRVAPVEIRGAVIITIEHIRAEAGDPAVQAPDEAVVDQAYDTIDTSCP